jgi:recombinational DNA repair protein (RecF pathway)
MYQLVNKACNQASKILDPDEAAKVVKMLIRRYKKREKLKKQKQKRKQKKLDRKNQRIAIFGKSRYYLSELFGQWVLYI